MRSVVSTATPAAREPMDDLTRQVQDALARLHDPVYLQTHPLVRRLCQQNPRVPGARAGKALRQWLLEAIATLRPAPKTSAASQGSLAWRGYRLLELRYLEALEPAAVQEQLGISKSQYFRDHARALDAVASVLGASASELAPGQRTRVSEASAPLHHETGVANTAAGHVPRPERSRTQWLQGPQWPTGFFGRDQDRRVLQTLLAQSRLVTLTGPGGAGKTRLAVEVAASLAATYEEGASLVDLASLRDPTLVLATMAQTLGLHDQPHQSLQETLIAWLQPKHFLLVLDNFEHVLEAAPAVAALLAACPRLTVLITSRAPLHLRWEQEFDVPPLALPQRERLPPVDELAQVPSVALFVERAQAVRYDFRLTEGNARAVATICVRLDGLPLAIELAAARVKVLTPEAMATRLSQRLPLLVSRGRDVPARHQTLRAALSWSYDLLGEEHQALFRRLGVFAGGCTLDAITAVCGGAETADAAPSAGTKGTGDANRTADGDEKADGRLHDAVLNVLEGIEALVDCSLLRRVDGSPAVASGGADLASEPRYMLLETVRECSLERLVAAGEADRVAQRHAAYFLALAEASEAPLHGPQSGAWLDRLEAELDNLRAALRWYEEHRRAEEGLRLAAAPEHFWHQRGHVTEARSYMAALLALPPSHKSATRARALLVTGRLAYYQGDHAAARTLTEKSVALLRQLGDQSGLSESLYFLVRAAVRQGDPAARAIAEESLALCRTLGEPRKLARALSILGTAMYRAEPVAARPLFEESLALHRALEDRMGTSMALNGLAAIARLEGENALARRHYEQSLSIHQQVGHKRGMAIALQNLGYVAQAAGDLRQAQAHLWQCLALFQEVGDRHGTGWCLAGLADLAAVTGEYARSARLFGAAAPHLNPSPFPLHPPDHDYYDQLVAGVRVALGEAAFTAAWAEGQAMTLEQAASSALADMAALNAMDDTGGSQDGGEPAVAATHGEIASPLTPREEEVAALVARGYSNRQIAGALVITEGTAGNHIVHILRKLGFTSRNQITTWVFERGNARTR
jgi:predicted ATPase/DNA-binding CsgD family transcriptional regulator